MGGVCIRTWKALQSRVARLQGSPELHCPAEFLRQGKHSLAVRAVSPAMLDLRALGAWLA